MPDQTGSSDRRPLKIVSHSKIIYWWPIWLSGYILAVISYSYGDQYLFNLINTDGSSWHTLVNLLYLCLILFVITVTNIKLEFLPAILVIMFVVIVLGALFLIFGRLSPLSDMPGFLIFMNKNFFFTFSSGLLIIWVGSVFGIDRLTVWELRPGALVHRRRLSGKVNTYNLEGAGADSTEDDVPCHIVLGLGSMGDITFRIAVPKPFDIHILNVHNVSSKLREAQRVIARSKSPQDQAPSRQ